MDIKKYLNLGTVGSVVGPVFDYNTSRNEGNGVVHSLVRAAASELIYSTPLGMGYMAANIAGAGLEYGIRAGQASATTQSRGYSANFGGYHVMSSNASNLRQRGLQAIHNSNSNARSVLGSEARSFHRRNMEYR